MKNLQTSPKLQNHGAVLASNIRSKFSHHFWLISACEWWIFPLVRPFHPIFRSTMFFAFIRVNVSADFIFLRPNLLFFSPSLFTSNIWQFLFSHFLRCLLLKWLGNIGGEMEKNIFPNLIGEQAWWCNWGDNAESEWNISASN